MKTYIQGKERCIGIKNLEADLKCDWENNRLEISGVAPQASIESGTELIFEVTAFTNPIMTGEIGGFKVFTAATKEDDMYYKIDKNDEVVIAEGAVKQWGQLSTAKVDVMVEVANPNPLAGIVQETDIMKITFYSPVPLLAGCTVKVVLPS